MLAYRLMLLTGLFLLAAPTAPGEEKPGSRGILVEEIKNDRPAFHVRVDADHANRVYKAGEEIKATVHTGRDGYLYLFYLDAAGKNWLIFPNFVQKENPIATGKPVTVPAADSKFRFKVGPPFGKEMLKAVVSVKPITLKGFEVENLAKKEATEIDPAKLKEFAQSVKAGGSDWAEHEIEITTVGGAAPPARPKEKRVGLFVGIGKYISASSLPVCPDDARKTAEAMKKRGGLDEAIVLTDEAANLKALEETICKKLVAQTKPGDTVVLFWSGHGGRLEVANGKMEHALVLSDTPKLELPAKPTEEDFYRAIGKLKEKMVSSEMLQRWLQHLDGRRIVVIADACFAGGLHDQGKSIKSANLSDESYDEPFLGDLVRRSKALNQKNLALVAASKALESSLVRDEQDLSVFTFFLLNELEKSDTPATLNEIINGVQKPLTSYVSNMALNRTQNPKKTQTPVLIDQMDPEPKFYFRPGPVK